MGAWLTQLRKGLVELSVLAALRHGETYGYQLLQTMASAGGENGTSGGTSAATSGGAGGGASGGGGGGLAVSESTVYPILARLAAEGCVTVRVSPSPAGPPRRYYRLTPAGSRRLDEMAAEWRSLHASLESLLKGDKQ